ncbi:MAG: hypothetical protein WCP57_11140 [Bacteroidota bacterium]
MNKVFNILINVLQVTLTFFALISIYMIYAFLDTDFGIEGLFGLILFQPIIGIALSVITIIICTLIGLPIRCNKNINQWWTTHFYISIIGALSGLVFFTVSFLPSFQETVTVQMDEINTIKHIPNSILVYIGWFLIAFSLLHLYLPKKITDKIKSINKE